MKLFIKAFIIATLFLMISTVNFAEIKTYTHTVKQTFGGSQSPDDARIAAIAKAKREVLERAGTYLESLTIVEEAVLSKDQVLALASGVLKTEIIFQDNYATKDGFGIIVKARIQVDTGLLEERVKKLMSDRTAIEQLTAQRKREKELLHKIKILEEENHKLAKQGDTQAAREEKKALTQKFKKASRGLNAVSLNKQAGALWKNGGFINPKKALELLNKAIDLDPNYRLSYNNRGSAYVALKQYTKAIQDYDRAIKLDPNFAMSYSNRGIAYVALKQYTKAIQDYDKAIEVDPNYVGSYNNRGNLYNDLKIYTKAIQDYNKAIELNPNCALFYSNRSTAYLELKEYTKAIHDVNKAINLDPNDAKAYNNRGNLYSDLKKYTKAIQDYNKAIELNPNCALFYSNRGNEYYYLKQYTKAIQDYDRAIKLDPNDAEAYNLMGVSFILMGLTDEGCAILRKACGLGNCKGCQWAWREGYCF